ncbi:MAG: SBBP repeat-containing protein [Bryobacteraceae bacterium]
MGGSNDDLGTGIAVDAHGNAYVTGRTASPDFPTKNAFQPMLGGPFASGNAFVTKISAR